jgi:hypothetical protein
MYWLSAVRSSDSLLSICLPPEMCVSPFLAVFAPSSSSFATARFISSPVDDTPPLSGVLEPASWPSCRVCICLTLLTYFITRFGGRGGEGCKSIGQIGARLLVDVKELVQCGLLLDVEAVDELVLAEVGRQREVGEARRQARRAVASDLRDFHANPVRVALVQQNFLVELLVCFRPILLTTPPTIRDLLSGNISASGFSGRGFCCV